MAAQMWESLAAGTNGQITPEDFEAASYRLVTEQVIYNNDRNSKVAYGLIERYEREFRRALAPLGVEVAVNRQLRYAYTTPQHGKAGSASVPETILALVLRAIYDEYARQGRMNDDGEVIIDAEELDEKYRILCGREIPLKSRLDALLDTMKRWGLARKSEEIGSEAPAGESGMQYVIAIRPAIVELLGESALVRLTTFREAAPASSPGASVALNDRVAGGIQTEERSDMEAQ